MSGASPPKNPLKIKNKYFYFSKLCFFQKKINPIFGQSRNNFLNFLWGSFGMANFKQSPKFFLLYYK